jgi:NAD(P)-dependent dehydrogenase (short-subunit alcohol dehydrogenase family)
MESQLHVLFNNAGIMTVRSYIIVAGLQTDVLLVLATHRTSYRAKLRHAIRVGPPSSPQSFPLPSRASFPSTNTLAPFLLIRLLYPTLLATAEASGAPTRLVWTSSSVQYYFKAPLKYDTLADSPARKKLGPFQLYCQSKFGAVMLAYALARRSAGRVVVTTCDPGNIQSDLQRHGSGGAGVKLLNKIVLHPLPFGAITQLYAGTSPEAAAYNGRVRSFFVVVIIGVRR